MYWSEEWSGVRLGRFARAILAVIFVLCLLAAQFLEVGTVARQVLWGVSAVIWVAILTAYIWRLVKSQNRRYYVTHSLTTPLLLLSPVPLLLQWPSVFFLVLVVAAFISMVREMAGGQREVFAYGAVIGVAIIAAIGMAFYEGRAEGGTIHTPGDAFVWAFTTVFRVGGVYQYRPDTDNGKVLGVVVVLAGAMFSALIISKFTSWLVGEREKKSGKMTPAEINQAIREGVAAAMKEQAPVGVEEGTSLAEISSGAPRGTLWIDSANVVGSQPDGWWRDRTGATDRLIDQILADERDGAAWGNSLGASQSLSDIRIVLEGEARGSQKADGTTEGGVPLSIRRASGTADDYLASEAESADVAVTSDRVLRDRLRARQVIVVGSKQFRDSLGSS